MASLKGGLEAALGQWRCTREETFEAVEHHVEEVAIWPWADEAVGRRSALRGQVTRGILGYKSRLSRHIYRMVHWATGYPNKSAERVGHIDYQLDT
jgi:hypothetical protein